MGALLRAPPLVVFRLGRLGVIGAGSMGCALIKGLIDDGYNDIIASRRKAEALYELHKRFSIETTTDNEYMAETADTVLLSVKPQHLDGVLRESWRGLDKL